MLSSDHQALIIAPLCLFNSGIEKQIRIELSAINSRDQFNFVVNQELKALKARCKQGLIPNVNSNEVGFYFPIDEFIILEGFNIDDQFFSDYWLYDAYFEAKKLISEGVDERAVEAYFHAVEYNPQFFTASEFERLYMGHFGDEYNFTEYMLDRKCNGQLESNPVYKYLDFEKIYLSYFSFKYPSSNGHFFTLRGHWQKEQSKAA